MKNCATSAVFHRYIAFYKSSGTPELTNNSKKKPSNWNKSKDLEYFFGVYCW